MVFTISYKVIMIKKYTLQNISVGNCFGWQIISNSSPSINVELRGKSGRLYFSENVSNNSVQIPNAQGADICNDTELYLTFACDKELKLIQLSQNMLSDSGELIGHSYHYNGNVAENSAEDIHIAITIWNSSRKVLSEKEFIAECFYKYLSEKDRYLFNYVSDSLVAEYYNELESKYVSGFDYQQWYNEKIKAAESTLSQYKLVFALLLNYDKHCIATNQLQYFVYKNTVIVFGKKQWNEEKLTVGSCPFQKIRGIILNDTELKEFNDAYGQLNSSSLFLNGTLKAAASYANKNSILNIKANRGLNFGNIGLDVCAEQSQQDDVITKSIKEADEGFASILIFPELSINSDKLSTLEESLKSVSHLNLVVAGSHYKGDPGNAYKNVSAIYAKVGGNWKIITEYNKLIPFTMGYTEKVADAYGIDKQKYPVSQYNLLVEDIEMNDNITLLPYKDCVVGIAICRDAMDLLDSHNPLHKYCDFADIMLVISDNTGDSNMFVGTAECLARWHNCATVYTNSIHEALANPDKTDNHLEISFALYPYKGSNVSSSTSVSGEINYAAEPFKAANFGPDIESIIFSPGIQYGTLDESKYCKIYEIVAAK